MSDILYRYDRVYEDDGDERLTGEVSTCLDEYRIIRRTEKGCWIRVLGKEKFILDTSSKKYAWKTKEEALAHAKRRTRDVIRWLKWYQRCAESFQKNLEEVKI